MKVRHSKMLNFFTPKSSFNVEPSMQVLVAINKKLTPDPLKANLKCTVGCCATTNAGVFTHQIFSKGLIQIDMGQKILVAKITSLSNN